MFGREHLQEAPQPYKAWVVPDDRAYFDGGLIYDYQSRVSDIEIEKRLNSFGGQQLVEKDLVACSRIEQVLDVFQDNAPLGRRRV